jgi:hypothetical protein
VYYNDKSFVLWAMGSMIKTVFAVMNYKAPIKDLMSFGIQSGICFVVSGFLAEGTRQCNMQSRIAIITAMCIHVAA